MAHVIHNTLILEGDEGFEQGLVTPLEMCTPEDRVAFAEEHAQQLISVYGMTPAEAQAHVFFAKDLEDD